MNEEEAKPDNEATENDADAMPESPQAHGVVPVKSGKSGVHREVSVNHATSKKKPPSRGGNARKFRVPGYGIYYLFNVRG